jgi:hypothetical protein
MLNTDLMHMLHQQRHQKLWAEAERERVQRDVAGARTPWACARLAPWLQRFSTRRLRGAARTGRAR